MIKYKFALAFQQNVVNIQTLSKENRGGAFTCLGCGHEMVPVLGEKKVKHFRHKFVKEINCSSETYLHKLAKNKFYETYQSCLKDNKPFKIKILMHSTCNFYEDDFLTTCELGDRLQEFDLTQFFKKIYLESKEGSFIPDVMLVANNQGKIFFEVVVTHASSQEKINSKYKIIEFLVDSEEDIKKIESCLMVQSSKIQFINFKRYQRGDICKGKCSLGITPYASEEVLYDIFLIYKNNTFAFTKLRLESLELLLPQILYFEYISLKKNEDMGAFYRNKVAEMYHRKFKIKSCILCKHHIIERRGEISIVMYCSHLREYGNSNMATDCQQFEPELQVCAQYIYPENNVFQKTVYIEEDDEGYL